jgi:hypothetical protein
MLWSPAIRAALLAETPWLDVFCPGCGTSRQLICVRSTAIRWPPSARCARPAVLMVSRLGTDAEAAWPICFAAVIRLDESMSLLAVEPLHSSFPRLLHSER